MWIFSLTLCLTTKETGLGIYSGGARWGFYQADFAPVVFSILASGGATNLDNLFFSETAGADFHRWG